MTDNQDRPIPGRDKDTLPWISIFKPAGLKEELEKMVRGKTIGSAPSEKTPTNESEKYNHNDWLKPLVLFDDLRP